MKTCTCDSLDLFKGGCLCGFLYIQEEGDEELKRRETLMIGPSDFNCSCAACVRDRVKRALKHTP